jgi:hypothetical protein
MARSEPVFDRAAGDAVRVSGDLTTLDATCTTYGEKITVLDSQFEGVPHPRPWYYHVGQIRHNMVGTYHNMLGAIDNCHAAVSADDSGAASSAISDMSAAATQLHQDTNYARSLALGR